VSTRTLAVGLRPAPGQGPADRGQPVRPAGRVHWDDPLSLSAEIEAAVVQVMTYLVENEYAALHGIWAAKCW
jgi:hypothetical protein